MQESFWSTLDSKRYTATINGRTFTVLASRKPSVRKRIKAQTTFAVYERTAAGQMPVDGAGHLTSLNEAQQVALWTAHNSF